MQNQINLSPITQFVQQVRSAELSQAKTVNIDMQKARLLVLALTEVLEHLHQDYETMYNQLKNSQDTDVVSISMDGGGLGDSK